MYQSLLTLPLSQGVAACLTALLYFKQKYAPQRPPISRYEERNEG